MINLMNRFLKWQGSRYGILRMMGRGGMELVKLYACGLEKETKYCTGEEEIMMKAKEKIREKTRFSLCKMGKLC